LKPFNNFTAKEMWFSHRVGQINCFRIPFFYINANILVDYKSPGLYAFVTLVKVLHLIFNSHFVKLLFGLVNLMQHSYIVFTGIHHVLTFWNFTKFTTKNKTHECHISGVTTCIFLFFQCLHVHKRINEVLYLSFLL